jgi:hypothetical protein
MRECETILRALLANFERRACGRSGFCFLPNVQLRARDQVLPFS